jgi:two-component system heavy metal sensor histidine kinase CusS
VTARSLRRRLTRIAIAVVGVTLCLSAFTVYEAFSRALSQAFDDHLLDDARWVASMVEERTQLPWEWEPAALGEFDAVQEPAYFQAWLDDGHVFARSPSLAEHELPRGSGAHDLQLPDGREGRVLSVELTPRLDNESQSRASGRKVTIAVARGSRELSRARLTLRSLLIGGCLLGVALAAFAIGWSVRVGLRPLEDFTRQLAAVDPKSLGRTLTVRDAPAELDPVVATLNDLLVRLEQAFAREQRFSGDVSHELRNPLAALRTQFEVALSRERTPESYREMLREALSTVNQLATLAERLLLLDRVESGLAVAECQDVGLRSLVDELIAAGGARIAERKLSVTNRVASGASVHSDLTLLRIAIGNLMNNAFDYTESGGTITVDSDPAQGLVIAVRDSGPAIPPQIAAQAFERFFRGDAGRGDTGEHAGIGLALVRAIADALGMIATVDNDADGGVSFRLRTASGS